MLEKNKPSRRWTVTTLLIAGVFLALLGTGFCEEPGQAAELVTPAALDCRSSWLSVWILKLEDELPPGAVFKIGEEPITPNEDQHAHILAPYGLRLKFPFRVKILPPDEERFSTRNWITLDQVGEWILKPAECPNHRLRIEVSE